MSSLLAAFMCTIVNIALLSSVLVCLATTGCRMAAPSEAAEIHAQKSSTLIAWLNEQQLPEDENLTNQADDFQPSICAELVARRQVNFLLDALDASNTPDASAWLVSDALCCIDDRRIYNAFVPLSLVTPKPASRGRIKTGHSEVIYSYQIS
jgi:hypothetical protein